MKLRNAVLKYRAVPVVTGLMVVAPAVPTWAADASGTVTSADWSSVITAVTGQISVSTVVGVLAAGVAACIGLVFMWWGLRKMTRTIMAAFRKGKLTV